MLKIKKKTAILRLKRIRNTWFSLGSKQLGKLAQRNRVTVPPTVYFTATEVSDGKMRPGIRLTARNTTNTIVS